jgi:2-oxoisovalerate dehydrogenase E2 component (dihydrolipoyl transacylase)
VRKTGRCVVVHEATLTSGFGAELCSLVQEACFYHLEAPIARVAGWDTPYPHAQEWDYFPGPSAVGRALLEVWSSNMAEHVIRLPDVGEGVAEAELVEWHVKVGDLVREDAMLGAVMTDKATVESRRPWKGRSCGWRRGRRRACGRFRDRPPEGLGEPVRRKGSALAPGHAVEVARSPRAQSFRTAIENARPGAGSARAAAEDRGRRTRAAPAVERPAPKASVRSRRRPFGCGRARRASTCARFPAPARRARDHDDLDAFLARVRARPGHLSRSRAPQSRRSRSSGCAAASPRRMALANARIPHITYVEEIDVTALEELRSTLNGRKRPEQPKLTLLPFLMRAMVRAVAEQPHHNALFDDEAGVVRQHAGVHIGVATQTSAGLMVPVVRHAEALDLWGCAAELARVAEASRSGMASRDELTGSTITITSLGAMGGIVTTPLINHPEVAIVGVNKMTVRPLWDGSAFVPRKMMNLSSSFDHRVVDGWDAAVFVQRLKTLLETPALIFIEGASP